MQVGDVISWERTFTEEDILAFGELSGDKGLHHVLRDEQGRLMAQGLLTATLPTKIGGDLNFIARELTFEFHRPVFAGDTIRCQVMLTLLEQGVDHIHLHCKWVCYNQRDQQVLTGRARGVIRDRA